MLSWGHANDGFAFRSAEAALFAGLAPDEEFLRI